MSTENATPFLGERLSSSSSSSRQSTQIGYSDERDSIDNLDAIDMEKMQQKDTNYVALERDAMFKQISSTKSALLKLHGYLSNHRTRVYSVLLLAASLVGLSLVGILWKHQREHNALLPGRLPGYEYTSSGVLLSCGDTLEEAEAVGCIFDIMTFAWTPPACLDVEIHDDVTSELSELAPTRGAGTWEWWQTENYTGPLEQSPAILSHHESIWTDMIYHRAHCLYLWRIMHKSAMRVIAGEREVYVYNKASHWEHVIHCNKLLNELDLPMSDPSMAIRVVGSCVRVDGWE